MAGVTGAGVRLLGLAGLVALVAAACSDGGSPVVAAATTAASTTTTVLVTTTPAPTTTGAPPTTVVEATTTLPPPVVVLPPPERSVTEQAWRPFAVVEGVVLHHPSSRVERVGFHESNHDGARQLEALDTAVAPTVLETRERGTGSQTAADVVVDPAVEIRAPVTGTVKRAGSYTLYCDYTDEYVVIVPDGQPWEHWDVKILHIVGVQVAAGDRVVAGETVIAAHAHQLPFDSQVDELRTADPPWPHVHMEAVDPTVPDRPTPGGCG